MSEVHLSPLTSEQVRNVITLKNSYSEFWESIKFSKGWDSPVAEKEDVLHLLEEAAEIVVRIRIHLDAINPGPKFRIADGSSKEYLWNLEKMPSETAFVYELVHATLQHSGHYVENLTKEKVDQYIKEIQQYTLTHEGEKLSIEGRSLEDKIFKVWNETDILLKVTCAEESKYWNHSLIKDTQQLLNQINTLKQRLLLIQKKRDFNMRRQAPDVTMQDTDASSSQQSAPPAVPVETQEAREEREKREREERERAQREEQERLAKQKDREGMIKINLVSEDTKNIEKELKEITNMASSLTKAKDIRPVDAIEKISDLKQRCLKNSTKLMQDLLTLDELVGLHESRAKKKEEVARIQTLLDNMDAVKSKLNSLEVEFQPRATQQKKEEELDRIAEEELQHLVQQKQSQTTQQKQPSQPERASPTTTTTTTKPQVRQPQPQPQQQQPQQQLHQHQQKQQQQPVEEKDKVSAAVSHPRFDLRSAWDRLRLDPKMEVHETADDYIIMANIPGIHKDEIETTVLPDGTLQISGVRVPSEKEINVMKRQIRSRYTPASPEEEDMLLLKLGVGRFGRFVKKFQLPKNLDVNAIQGQYKDGILLIRIPKPVQAEPPPPPMRRQRTDVHPFFGFPESGFLNDLPFWDSRF